MPKKKSDNSKKLPSLPIGDNSLSDADKRSLAYEDDGYKPLFKELTKLVTIERQYK